LTLIYVFPISNVGRMYICEIWHVLCCSSVIKLTYLLIVVDYFLMSSYYTTVFRPHSCVQSHRYGWNYKTQEASLG